MGCPFLHSAWRKPVSAAFLLTVSSARIGTVRAKETFPAVQQTARNAMYRARKNRSELARRKESSGSQHFFAPKGVQFARNLLGCATSRAIWL